MQQLKSIISLLLITCVCSCTTTDNDNQSRYKQSSSGLKYRILAEGQGKKAGENAMVVFHLVGSLTDGRQFLNSIENGRAIQVRVKDVDIAGVKEALSRMKKAAKWQLIVPSRLAYGTKGLPEIKGRSGRGAPPGARGERRFDSDTGYAGVPPDTTVYFYVHLIDIVWSK